MVRASLKVLVADVLLLVSAYAVLQDLQWRSSYASQEGLTPSYVYSVLTQSFGMTGRGLSLQSPPTLDWIQIIAVALVLVNAWYLFSLFGERRKRRGPGVDVTGQGLASQQSTH